MFRVDNPHTKPLAFWEWMIGEVQSIHPDSIFLAEAFTRPKVMCQLAKAGFTQSYTYFTWRNTKWELQDYLTELTQTQMKEYFRGNFFANTPDILPHILQLGGRPAFRMRLVLAATLSSVYGIYSGFELVENTPRGTPGATEYYQDSEMYQHKVWDWDRPGNIIDDITRVNRIRRENPALQQYDNLRFHFSDSDQLLVYSKATPDRDNIIVCVVNVDTFWAQAGWLEVPAHEWGVAADQPYVVHDLMTDERFTWRGNWNWVRLDPHDRPAHVLRVEIGSAARVAPFARRACWIAPPGWMVSRSVSSRFSTSAARPRPTYWPNGSTSRPWLEGCSSVSLVRRSRPNAADRSSFARPTCFERSPWTA